MSHPFHSHFNIGWIDHKEEGRRESHHLNLVVKMLRRTSTKLGVMCSNMIAHPATGRWFNPPSQWFGADIMMLFGIFLVLGSAAAASYLSTQSSYSPFMAKNYYPRCAYTKEFIHKYDRTNRWRHY